MSHTPPAAADAPRVLVVAARWWPLSARLAVALRRQGCDVFALCPAHHPLEFVAGVRRVGAYSALDSLGSLRSAIEGCRPDVIVPCDDGVVRQLHALHAAEPALRALIERSLGSPSGYPVLDSRYRFLDLARTLGIPVPETRLVRRAADLQSWHDQAGSAAVLKINGECGGNGVRIARSPAESAAALRELTRPRSALAAWKRVLVDCDPLALWMRHNPGEAEMTVQQLLPGRPANSMMACSGGRVLGLVSVVVVAAESRTGAATVVRTIVDGRMTDNARLIAHELQLSGFHGLDYLIDSDSGTPYLLEINPRCTQLGHLEFSGMGSLAAAYCRALAGDAAGDTLEPSQSRLIAFYPQALSAGEAVRALLDPDNLDVPGDCPRLLAELQRPPWPRRHLASRLYHALRWPANPEPILFGTGSRTSPGRRRSRHASVHPAARRPRQPGRRRTVDRRPFRDRSLPAAGRSCAA